jgi:hypothetical protein
MYAATTKDEGNAADGCFSAACSEGGQCQYGPSSCCSAKTRQTQKGIKYCFGNLSPVLFLDRVMAFSLSALARVSLPLKAEKDTWGSQSLVLFFIKNFIKKRNSDVSKFLPSKKGTLPYHTGPGVPIPESQP